jgi:hypothetical protein
MNVYPNKKAHSISLQDEYCQPVSQNGFSIKEKPQEIPYLAQSKGEGYITELRVSKETVDVFLGKELVGSMPKVLSYLLPNIEKSKKMLLLLDDWDTEGSEKYSDITWIKSIKFLIDYAKTLYSDSTIQIAKPKIYEGPKGSIDIIWETKSYRLLVNIDKNGEDALFYSDNYKDQKTEGAFKLNHFNHYLLPIAAQI